MEKRFVKGLFKDTGHLDQPEGTWRYAKNAVLNNTKGAISNEKGNKWTTKIPIGYRVLGSISISDGKIVLFLISVDLDNSFSEIGIFENDVYTTMFVSPVTEDKQHLNFDILKPIEGTFKVDSKGDLMVYWVDDLNPPRAFNLSRQQRSLDIFNNTSLLYGIVNPSDSVTHIGLLDLFPNSGRVPRFSNEVISSGGALLSGVYYLALAYVDEDLVATNYLNISNPISIVEESSETRPTTNIDGARAGNQTSKAITWRIRNINSDYKFIRAAIVRKKGEAVDVFRLNDIAINVTNRGSVQLITFTGTESISPGSPEEIMIDTIGYESAKTINQLDNILYVGNVKSTKDVGYQQYANAIRLESSITSIGSFDPFYATQDNFETGFSNTPIDMGHNVDESKSYRNNAKNSRLRGYLRDETYAFYIAFILNDGSMSYAYHIPGRAQLYHEETTAIASTGGVFNEENLDLENAKRFHIKDFSDPNAQANFVSNHPLAYPEQQMNYWMNATEMYPNTPDFDIFKIVGTLNIDGTVTGAERAMTVNGNASITLRDKNVRHHHFPSNDNYYRKSIGNGNAVTSSQAALHTQEFDAQVNFTGTYKFRRNTSSGSKYHDITGGTAANEIKYTGDNMGTALTSEWSPPLRWQDVDLSGMTDGNVTDTTIFSSNSSVDGVSTSGLYSGDTGVFTANQNMLIDNMSYKSYYRRDAGDGQFNTFKTRVVIEKVSTGQKYFAGTDHQVSGDDWGINSNYNSTWSYNKYDYNQKSGINTMHPNSTSNGTVSGEPVPIELTSGDRMWLECRAFVGSSPGFWVRQANTDEMHGGDYSYWQFDIDTTPSTDFLTTANDVKIAHNVYALGFHLDDIKIPKSIADKVQGFRIYRAKRDIKNQTILGQSVVVPMTKETSQIGMCSEAMQAEGAESIMQAVSSETEVFYKTSPWPDSASSYGSTGYTHFTFHDFNLLRTKNSLSGATHIKPIYMVNNLVWNGPTLKQDKKMVTTVVSVNDDTPDTLKELWGYDTEFNCYSEEIKSAIFIGLNYRFNVQTSAWAADVESHRYPRMLAQKAKTYLLGDTIFEGEALGFGGKIFNEYGESCIALALKNNQGLPALKCTPDGVQSDYSDYFGYAHPDAPSWLVNHSLISTSATAGSDAGVQAASRYYNYMVNLHAHKTDIYKSLDSQELVYTGFEILGDDLKNFVFIDDENDPNYLQHVHAGDLISNGLLASTLYSTKLGNTFDEPARNWTGGIYGGDTFLTRHGFVSTLTPSDANTTSEPTKAIYYNIVESKDNINFRHSEDGDSLYFPGTPAKTILKKSGHKDYSHFDNIKYNDNYSADNDVRPAVPLPVREIKQVSFPTRAHRSAMADNTSLIDNYRIFLANQYKDLPKNRGDLFKLSSFNNLLYFHMQNSLYATKGKQTMEMKDGSEAFIGSGDIFVQPPDEILQTKLGYGGTQSQRAAITTRYGYFFVNKISKKVFMMSDKLNDISELGMDNWFFENLDFHLERWGFPDNVDNPVIGVGLHSVWDSIQKRILLTKNDLKPTTVFRQKYQLYLDNGKDTPDAVWYNSETGYYHKTEIVTGSTDPGVEPPEIWQTFMDGTVNGYAGFLQTAISYEYGGAATTPMYIPLTEENTNLSQNSGWYIQPGMMFVLIQPTGLDNPSMTNVSVYANSGENDTAIFIEDDSTWQQENLNTAELGLQQWHGLNVYGYHLYNNPTTIESINYEKISYEDIKYFKPDGWTISFYPEINAWGSFHTYLPYTYFTKFNGLYSMTSEATRLQEYLDPESTLSGTEKLKNIDAYIWKHLVSSHGKYYYDHENLLGQENAWIGGNVPDLLTIHPFELEFIDNSRKVMDSTFSSISYTVDVIGDENSNLLNNGFTDFFVYNTRQISGQTELEYLVNTRLSGNNWKINSFRDIAELELNQDSYYMSTSLNVVGVLNEGTLTTLEKQAMFNVDGIHEIINNYYINEDKAWNLRRKFVGKWLGIRLICDNIRNNSVNLYTAETDARKYYR